MNGDPRSNNLGPSVGTLLRAHRQRAGHSLADVAQALRIREPFLEAIEDGRYADLPGPTYAIGFARVYAEHLGLDGAEVLRRLKEETAGLVPSKRSYVPAPLPEGGAPKGAILLIGALIALAAYGTWYFLTSRDTSVVELVTPVPERLDSRETTKPETADAPATPPATAEPPTPPAAAGAAAPATPAPEKTPAAIPTPPPTPPVAGQPAPGGPAAAEPPAHILLRAKADTWIEIRDDISKKLVFARLLRAGESYGVPDRPGLKLVVGNAGGLEVLVDGSALPPLGREGTVRRNLPLEPQSLRAAAAASGQ